MLGWLAVQLFAFPALAIERELLLDIEGTKLSGSLLLPDRENSGIAVLLIAGSGPTDRNGNVPMAGVNAGYLQQLAVGLVEAGIGSLRYDKRGVGASAAAGKSEAELRFQDFVADAGAWARLLREQEGVRCVFLAGHSEGALIATLAAKAVPLCGLVLLSGSGRPLDAVLMEQLRNQNLPAGTLSNIAAVLAGLKEGLTFPTIPATDPLFRPSVQPYLASQLQFDPAVELRTLTLPVMIIQGDNDLQIAVENAKLLAAARPDASLLLVPDMNHVLKTSPRERAGNVATYSNPDLPLASGLLEPLVQFLQRSAER